MSSGPLRPDVALGVKLSATCSRHKYDTDPTTLLEELQATAGDRGDILAKEAGTWAGFYQHEIYVSPTVVAALKGLPGVEPWIELGDQRARAGSHSTSDITG